MNSGKDSLYSRWQHMKVRCTANKVQASEIVYLRYVKRGIKVYEPWLKNFKLFRAYCYWIHPNLDFLLSQGYLIKWDLDKALIEPVKNSKVK